MCGQKRAAGWSSPTFRGQEVEELATEDEDQSGRREVQIALTEAYRRRQVQGGGPLSAAVSCEQRAGHTPPGNEK